MTQDARTRWLPVVVATALLVPAGFLAAVSLFTACFIERDGTGDQLLRAQVCDAAGGSALPLVTAVAFGATLFALVRAVRRGSRSARVWLLVPLPALALVLVPLLVNLLPAT